MGAAPSAWRTLPDRLLFGAAAERPGLGGALRRLARYPYALTRDLIAGQLNLHAMGLVYATLLAIVPLIALCIGILQIFNAQGVLEPLLREVLRPMGAAGAPLTARLFDLANRVHGALVGSVGLALLVWTLVETIAKVEGGFNFVWHVEQARTLGRRLTEYVTALIVGPVAIGAVVGAAHLAAASAPAQALQGLPLLHRVGATALQAAPWASLWFIVSLLYVLLPNTRVRWGPALLGGAVAALLWTVGGHAFAATVLFSTRLMVVYAGFAIVIAALIWIYLGWLILLFGSLIAFYAQHPSYLRLGLRELQLSGADAERLALSVMFMVADAHQRGAPRPRPGPLAEQLGYPGIAVSASCACLADAGLLLHSSDGSLVPARDLLDMSVWDILAAARGGSRGLIHSATVTPPAVARLHTALETALRARCGALGIVDLLPAARGGSLPGDRHLLEQD